MEYKSTVPSVLLGMFTQYINLRKTVKYTGSILSLMNANIAFMNYMVEYKRIRHIVNAVEYFMNKNMLL